VAANDRLASDISILINYKRILISPSVYMITYTCVYFERYSTLIFIRNTVKKRFTVKKTPINNIY